MSERLPSLVLQGSFGPQASYEVIFGILSPLNEFVLEKLGELINLFVDAGSHGAFASANVSPNESQLTFAASNPHLPEALSYKLEANCIDMRAFQLLRNMSCRLKHQSIDVRTITVLDLNQNILQSVEIAEPNEDNEENIYPEISAYIGFEVRGEESEFSKQRRCLVEMRTPVNSEQVNDIAKKVEPWYLLLEAGAYALPVGFPDETESIRGSVTIFDEFSIEISVDRFQASESAWNGLINLLDAYSVSSDSVKNVVID